ncbi:MAG: SBBP repeat-containing protein, partial [Promethearchaeota archaeon]
MKTKNTISVLLIAFLFAFSIPFMGGTPSAIDNDTDYMDASVILSGDSSGYGISFATYFGGSGYEQFRGVVTDSHDNIYFVGDTTSGDLPMVNSFDPTYKDGFLAKFSPDGSELLFSTYFGSPSVTQPQAITIDEEDNIWICGSTSSGFTLVNPIDDTYGGGNTPDAFVAQFSPDGELMFSSYLGGNNYEIPNGIAAEAGIVYVTGVTHSPDFPVVNPLFPDSLGDGFLTKIDTVQHEISWSTRFEGFGDDVAIDSNGDVYLTGRTRGPDFPATISFGTIGGWHEDSFVLKTNADGNSIEYATRVGGNEPDKPKCIRLLADGSVVVAGYTYSNDMPVVNPLKGTFGGERDGFLYILDSTGSSLEYLTYFGGSSLDIIANLDIDSTGNFVISGTTFSQDFPLVQPLFDTLEVGTSDAFVSILNPLTNELTFSTLFSGTTYGTGMTVDTDDSIIFGGNTGGSTQPTPLPVKNALYPYNSGSQDSFVCKLSSTPPDTTPPETMIELSGTTGLNDWFISEALGTLTATDDISGVDYSEYSYDGIIWHLYAEPFLIPFEGEITIYYRSKDIEGNSEIAQSVNLKIIKLPIDVIDDVIAYFDELEFPQCAQCYINTAIRQLGRAIINFEEAKFIAAFNKLQLAVESLMYAMDCGAEVQYAIDTLVRLVQDLTDQIMSDTMNKVDEDNYYIIIAQEKYDTALD